MSRPDSPRVVALRTARDGATTRINAINCELTAGKLEWFKNGNGTPYGQRLELESEKAALIAQRAELQLQIAAAREEDDEQRRMRFTRAICELLESKGLGDLIVEARRMAGQTEGA